MDNYKGRDNDNGMMKSYCSLPIAMTKHEIKSADHPRNTLPSTTSNRGDSDRSIWQPLQTRKDPADLKRCYFGAYGRPMLTKPATIGITATMSRECWDVREEMGKTQIDCRNGSSLS